MLGPDSGVVVRLPDNSEVRLTEDQVGIIVAMFAFAMASLNVRNKLPGAREEAMAAANALVVLDSITDDEAKKGINDLTKTLAGLLGSFADKMDEETISSVFPLQSPD